MVNMRSTTYYKSKRSSKRDVDWSVGILQVLLESFGIHRNEWVFFGIF